MHIIPLVTIPTSGTHFMAAFFEEFKIVRHTTDWQTMAKQEKQFIPRPDITTLIRGHIHPTTLPYILSYGGYWKLIVSLREPLLQFLSYRNHNGTEIAHHLLPLWKILVAEVNDREPHYIALDLLRTQEERANGLVEVLRASKMAGLPEAAETVAGWSYTWPKDKHNSQGAYPLKVA